MEKVDALAALRDIHIPQPPPGLSPWPTIAALAVIALALLLLGVLVARWRNCWTRAMRDHLAALDPASDNATAEAAKLLRRAAISRLGPSVARLQGAEWLAALDGLFRTRFFSAGAGRAFGEALYARPSDEPTPATLLSELRRLAARRGWSPW